jgi:hypothetical protein
MVIFNNYIENYVCNINAAYSASYDAKHINVHRYVILNNLSYYQTHQLGVMYYVCRVFCVYIQGMNISITLQLKV